MNIKEYFEKGTFIIPNYQRGYKWGVPNSDGECAVSILMDSLINAYKSQLHEYYVQGVTVYIEDEKVVLIDGQQRTTTFYLLLKYLNHDSLPKINYDIRKDSDCFLKNSKINSNLIEYVGDIKIDENAQDIFYFNRAVNTIHSKLASLDNVNFKEYVLEKVKLFFIEINKEDATKVFSMMNGQKAIMKNDELIKASLLTKASRLSKEGNKEISLADEWEINSLRSRYAREWDKWLYWWNKKSVKDFYGSGNNPMGLLLEYFHCLNDSKDYNYKNFNEAFFKDIINAKQSYKAIRDLQKTFEDWFNDYNYYNYLGLIFKSVSNKKEAILYFLKSKSSIVEIKEYAKWSLVGATHREITKSDELEKKEINKEAKALDTLKNLSSQEVYNNFNDLALKQLLRLNVELDCQLNRKFDFNLYGLRSLEHIYPKSWENEENSKLKFPESCKEKYSVHCIGNLVLLDSKTNSSFSNNSFEDKKKAYFNLENAKWSLKLLHTVSVFTKNEWNANAIIENQKGFLTELERYYNLQNN